ncbi:MAG: SDR family oxidoreductase [Trueperaceae bacterium]
MSELSKHIALVTGAASGIGAATALRLAEAGANVALVDQHEQQLEDIATRIRELGREPLILLADVSDEKAVRQGYETLLKEWGKLDSVFANAGINGVWAPLEELNIEEWQKTLSVNLTGTFLTVKYAIPHLKHQGGSIIVTASVNGTRMFSNTGATAYATSKAGQVAFVKMMALELAHYKIRVNVICPGAITTNINANTEQRDLEKVKKPVEYPLGEIPLTNGGSGNPKDIAELVLFLASERSQHITGTEVWIDGGQSLLQG